MPGATASGSDAQGGGGGADKRKCTPEQAAAVRRIMACNALAFYDILGLEAGRKTCSDADIKKAYRKQSLLTHPDKNTHEHAVKAFQMVSRAFDVLSSKDKRDRFDRDGADPDSRFAQAQAQNPFSGFASRAGGGGGMGGGMNGGGRFDDEVSPEEMFQRFFGGGGGFGGPFGGFDTGPQFVFNFGGGPGIRMHQFGGGIPRRRPRAAREQTADNSSMTNTLLGLLPILFLFIFPLLGNIFSGLSGGEAATPRMVFDHAQPPLYTAQRTTPNYGVRYFVNPHDIEAYTAHKLAQLDKTAEVALVRHLRNECENEMLHRQRLVEAAQGWFFQDPDKMARANEYQMPACSRLETLGVLR